MASMARIGSIDSSNDALKTGSPNVIVNGLSAGRIGSIDSSNDALKTGSPNVIVG